jgi:hypothetical protein
MNTAVANNPPKSTPSKPVYAGVAYEIHLQRPGGADVAVDPMHHTFHTGDRFVLYYRPTLPGVMTVYNTDPTGKTKQIDTQDIAAGQLAKLGPYRFVKDTGRETLRLVLNPCASKELLVATRSIVRVEADDESPVAAPRSMPLQSCAAKASSHGMATRGIERVDTEGNTAFAMERALPDEESSGKYAPRGITIHFLHE